MGCLNSDGHFSHWFANIHLSGPCNRSCYFCIGQHMMALDSYNTLSTWPLPGWDNFIAQCLERGVREVYLTGTNTEPLLYQHIPKLVAAIREDIPGAHVGVRSNGLLVTRHLDRWRCFDEASITVCSTDRAVNTVMMGGRPPELAAIFSRSGAMRLTANVVLGPENIGTIEHIVANLARFPFARINLREPYGQPHIGDPLASHHKALGHVLGMPTYRVAGMDVTYWDVHYVEVESVNLYASGRVSLTYPISKGHAPSGEVHDQSAFTHGRHAKQWNSP